MTIRVWRRDSQNVTYAVITHDDGEILTVQPNTYKMAKYEAKIYSGEGGAHVICIIHQNIGKGFGLDA